MSNRDHLRTITNGPSFNIENVLHLERLKHNLISTSQLCDKGYKVAFESTHSFIYDKLRSVVLVGKRVNKIYLLDLKHASYNIHYFLTTEYSTWWWHKRICHIHTDHLNRLDKKQLIEGLPQLKFVKNKIYEACQKGEQTKISFKPKNCFSTSKSLELLHMDFFVPSRTTILSGNLYALVI